MQEQMISLQKLEENGSAVGVDLSAIEKALWQELSFQDTISTEVVAAILDHVVVCEGSTKQRINLELYLRLGQTASVTFSRERFAFWNTSFLTCGSKAQGAFLCPISSLNIDAKDSEETLSGNMRFDNYNRHLDLLYNTHILLPT